MQAVANVYNCRPLINITEPTTGFNETTSVSPVVNNSHDKTSNLIEIHYCHLHSAGILLFE